MTSYRIKASAGPHPGMPWGRNVLELCLLGKR
jgi:hypothetical protein